MIERKALLARAARTAQIAGSHRNGEPRHTDPFLTRDWAERHATLTGPLHDGLIRIRDTVRVSLDRLNRHEFDAPWKRDLARRAKRRHA